MSWQNILIHLWMKCPRLKCKQQYAKLRYDIVKKNKHSNNIFKIKKYFFYFPQKLSFSVF